MTKTEQRAELDRLIKFFSSATIPKGKVQFARWASSDNLALTIESKIIRATHNLGGWGTDSVLSDLRLIEEFLKNQ